MIILFRRHINFVSVFHEKLRVDFRTKILGRKYENNLVSGLKKKKKKKEGKPKIFA